MFHTSSPLRSLANRAAAALLLRLPYVLIGAFTTGILVMLLLCAAALLLRSQGVHIDVTLR